LSIDSSSFLWGSAGAGNVSTISDPPPRKGKGRYNYKLCSQCHGIKDIYDTNMKLLVYKETCRSKSHSDHYGCHRRKRTVTFDEALQVARESRFI
jgi:hypothetical protein